MILILATFFLYVTVITAVPGFLAVIRPFLFTVAIVLLLVLYFGFDLLTVDEPFLVTICSFFFTYRFFLTTFAPSLAWMVGVAAWAVWTGRMIQAAASRTAISTLLMDDVYFMLITPFLFVRHGGRGLAERVPHCLNEICISIMRIFVEVFRVQCPYFDFIVYHFRRNANLTLCFFSLLHPFTLCNICSLVFMNVIFVGEKGVFYVFFNMFSLAQAFVFLDSLRRFYQN